MSSYWIMLSERSHELELSIDGTPTVIEALDLRFDIGVHQATPGAAIDVDFEPFPDARIPDNIPAYGCRGLLVNSRVRAVFEGVELDNVQYVDARLVDARSGHVVAPLWIANVLGRVRAVDRQRSDVTWYRDGAIQFIDSLVLRAPPAGGWGHLVRLDEYPPLLLASDTLKRALESAGITGFTFSRPEAFSL